MTDDVVRIQSNFGNFDARVKTRKKLTAELGVFCGEFRFFVGIYDAFETSPQFSQGQNNAHHERYICTAHTLCHFLVHTCPFPVPVSTWENSST